MNEKKREYLIDYKETMLMAILNVILDHNLSKSNDFKYLKMELRS
jgi:hypothetical protein